METNRPYLSAVSDLPVTSADGDFLSNNKYATGLCEFIRRAGTPLTIGIQGGWGSGKTSLINMLQAGLLKSGNVDGDTLCVTINAWQHSLFQAKNQAAVAFSLLGDMIRGIEDAIQESNKISTDVKDRVKKIKISGGMVTVLKLVGGIAAQGLNVYSGGLVGHVAHHIGAGVEAIQGGMNAVEERGSELPAMALQKLHSKIRDAVQEVVSKNAIKRFVFFIDDLDRVHPQTAVEILDVLKNIFDVPNCIFVLAIDFDVVVKGLEGKFGVRSDENARQFRQYFDKIIQVPFTMPVSAYESTVVTLVEELLKRFNFGNAEDIPNELPAVAWSITDGTPRSIKRIINTLSLLHLIKHGEAGDPSEVKQDVNVLSGDSLTVWFAVVGMQINFPDIYQQLERNPDFLAWNAEVILAHDPARDSREVPKLSQFVDDEGLTRNFQQCLNLLCQKDPWLRGRELALRSTFAAMAKALRKMDQQPGVYKKAASITTPSLDFLAKALTFASVTSLDKFQSPEENDSIRTDEVTKLARQTHQLLAKTMDELELFESTQTYAKQHPELGRGGRRYKVSCRAEKKDLVRGVYIDFKRDNKDTYTVFVSIDLKPPFGNTNPFRDALQAYDGATYVRHDGLRAPATTFQVGGDINNAASSTAEKAKELSGKAKVYIEEKFPSR